MVGIALRIGIEKPVFKRERWPRWDHWYRYKFDGGALHFVPDRDAEAAALAKKDPGDLDHHDLMAA